MTSWNLPDSQVHLEVKTEASVATAQNYTEKNYTVRGGHHTYFLDGVQLWWGHPTTLKEEDTQQIPGS